MSLRTDEEMHTPLGELQIVPFAFIGQAAEHIAVWAQ